MEIISVNQSGMSMNNLIILENGPKSGGVNIWIIVILLSGTCMGVFYPFLPGSITNGLGFYYAGLALFITLFVFITYWIITVNFGPSHTATQLAMILAEFACYFIVLDGFLIWLLSLFFVFLILDKEDLPGIIGEEISISAYVFSTIFVSVKSINLIHSTPIKKKIAQTNGYLRVIGMDFKEFAPQLQIVSNY